MHPIESGDAKRRIPFAERVTCSVDDAVIVSGIGRSTLYKLCGAARWNPRRPGIADSSASNHC